MADETVPERQNEALALEYLTGSLRGRVTWLGRSELGVFQGPKNFVGISEIRPGELRDDLIARLHPVEDSYEIVARKGHSLWVNGILVDAQQLKHGDIIEFGDTGPMVRLLIYSQKRPVRMTVTDIFSDCAAYLKVSRQPVIRRMFRAFFQISRRLTRETTLLFRTSVVIALLVLAGLGYQQMQFNRELQQKIEMGAVQVEGFAAALAGARKEALTPADLKSLRLELGLQLTSNIQRLEALEERSLASKRVITDSIPSVAFLQGSYGYKERSSGRFLRHVLGEDGRPLISPFGLPQLSLEGNGPPAERQFTGTGFVVGDQDILLTARHVALPWKNDASVGVLSGQGFEPAMIRFVAYLPHQKTAIEVALLKASDTADIALLKRIHAGAKMAGLVLSTKTPELGDEVIVMGYPTGLRSMLAQSGETFVKELQESKNTDFWAVASRLAEADQIAPLASRGIVGQATPTTLVYDAETTFGGSGGPVLNTDGEVIALNAAILPEYGGSNFGVPVAKIWALIKDAGQGVQP